MPRGTGSCVAWVNRGRRRLGDGRRDGVTTHSNLLKELDVGTHHLREVGKDGYIHLLEVGHGFGRDE
jgi:hypothetical protein